MLRYPLFLLLQYATLFIALFYGAFLLQSESFLTFVFHLFIISFPPVLTIAYTQQRIKTS